MIGRRQLLASGMAATLAAGLPAGARSAPPRLPPATDDRLRAAARESRRRIALGPSGFSGEAYDWLVAQGRAARFFCLGEEHGIAENAVLAAQLFRDLVTFGYRRVAVEISPPMAAEIDAVLRNGGFEALRSFLVQPGQAVAFFGMREEAQWLASARATVGGRKPVVWGTDYEPFADRHLVSLLARARKPAAAEAALGRLAAASRASWAQFDRTRDPKFMFGFTGDPALVRAVGDGWPNPDARSAEVLRVFQETLEINRLWMSGDGYASNARRAANLRENFLRYWRPDATAADAPRVFLKYGSNHLVRGLTSVGTFDTGSLAAELAALRGERSFHLLVLPGAGSPVAAFDITDKRYKPNTPKDGYAVGLERVTGEAWPDAPTLFDTAPLRRLAASSREKADPALVRAVMGYDAILVLSGSTASSNL